MIKTPFTLLRLRPDEVRGESMNVGLVTFPPGGPRVYFDAPPTRLKAFHPDFEHINGDQWARELEEVLPKIGDLDAQINWLRFAIGPVTADAELGHFFSDTFESITDTVEQLLERLVHAPEREIAAPMRPHSPSRGTLKTQLKSWFRQSKVFSSRTSDLSQRRIVPNYPVDAADDLYADFAMKNGSIHVLEVVDWRGVDRITRGLRGEAGLTAILLDQAKKRFSESSRRIAITAADDYKTVSPLLNLVTSYADDVVAIESAEDRQRLADFVATALHAKAPLSFPGFSSR